MIPKKITSMWKIEGGISKIWLAYSIGSVMVERYPGLLDIEKLSIY